MSTPHRERTDSLEGHLAQLWDRVERLENSTDLLRRRAEELENENYRRSRVSFWRFAVGALRWAVLIAAFGFLWLLVSRTDRKLEDLSPVQTVAALQAEVSALKQQLATLQAAQTNGLGQLAGWTERLSHTERDLKTTQETTRDELAELRQAQQTTREWMESPPKDSPLALMKDSITSLETEIAVLKSKVK
jgi:predicted  nucleic acid-binding Zn-ribbon protein